MLAETGMKCGMACLMVAAVPGADGGSEVWAQWGLAGLVVGFTLWRDYLREKAMAAAMEKRQAEAVGQQKWVQDTLMGALERNTLAMQSLIGGRRHLDGEDGERSPG